MELNLKATKLNSFRRTPYKVWPKCVPRSYQYHGQQAIRSRVDFNGKYWVAILAKFWLAQQKCELCIFSSRSQFSFITPSRKAVDVQSANVHCANTIWSVSLGWDGMGWTIGYWCRHCLKEWSNAHPLPNLAIVQCVLCCEQYLKRSRTVFFFKCWSRK